MEIRLLSKRDEEKVKKVLDQYHVNIRLYQPGHVFLLAIDHDQLYGFIDLVRLEEVNLIYALPSLKQFETFSVLLSAAERIGYGRIVLHSSINNVSFFSQFGYQHQGQGTMVKILSEAYHFKNYEEAEAFITSQKSRVYSLDHFKEFMRLHFNIQYVLPCVHIGGTNGKGSTLNYTKEVLKEAGYKVGTFTTPAIEERLDIIRINDEVMREKIFVKLCNRFMAEFVEAKLSKFEIEVFVAVMYFIYKAVDIALFEVGLGGTLDATNIIGPLLSVVTNIGLDHTEYLGHTYNSIALNKAGIIKDGVPFMTAEKKAECLDVFYEETRKHHSELILIDEPYDIHYGETIHYDYHGYHITLNTPARYQVINSALAINILETIEPLFPFTPDQLIKGLRNACWPERFEKIHENPLVIIDGAHNKEGMEAFYESAQAYDHPHIIFTALKDKDTQSMLEILLRLSDDITVTQFEHPRAMMAKDLARDYPVKIDEDYRHAIDEALKQSRPVFITGSLYFLSEVRKYLKSK